MDKGSQRGRAEVVHFNFYGLAWVQPNPATNYKGRTELSISHVAFRKRRRDNSIVFALNTVEEKARRKKKEKKSFSDFLCIIYREVKTNKSAQFFFPLTSHL